MSLTEIPEEHFRFTLAGGRQARVFFQGPDPTKKEVAKLVSLLDSLVSQYPDPERDPKPKSVLEEIESAIVSDGGALDAPVRLPDGSGIMTASLPLPKDHWLYADGPNDPPMVLRWLWNDFKESDAANHQRQKITPGIVDAIRYAVRGATMNGTISDFDPDALVQNAVVGLLGYYTQDGLLSGEASPPPDAEGAAEAVMKVIDESEAPRKSFDWESAAIAMWKMLDDIEVVNQQYGNDHPVLGSKIQMIVQQRELFLVRDDEQRICPVTPL